MTSPEAAEALRRRGRAAAFAFVALGIALRVATAFPVHKYAADADCLNSGLVALRISEGHPKVWYTPRRIGALECYGHAAAFRLFGASRAALAVAPLLSSSLALVLFAGLSFAWLGPVAGPLSTLLFAVPPPAYLFWTYMPNGYPETMLLSVAVVFAAERVRQAPEDGRRLALLGLVAGLGFWNSIQTLTATLPAFLWLLATRRRHLVRARTAGVVTAAFLFGALPWIAWNVLVPLGSFRDNFSVRPASGLHALAENTRYLAAYALPELVSSVDPENGLNPPSRLALLLRAPVFVIWAAAALFALSRASAALAKRLRGLKAEPPPEVPLLLVALTVCVFAVLSGAGQMRGLTVRYVLPAFLVLPAALALAVAAAARAARAAGILSAVVVCAVLAFNVSGYFLPGSDARRLWEKRMDADTALVSFLQASEVEAVLGEYWATYPVNFLSHETVRAVPFQTEADFYGVEGALPAGPLRWALVSNTQAELMRLAGTTGTSGDLVEVGYERWVFLPASSPEGARAFVGRFREAFFAAR
ncbi:MAG TPA: glycosyltransferase family 39 protein [Thermoanaerobaculia bacterium]|nr:glycosyltransferase family 39 protein [Thermoanaerobaculia bacterium]